jgi:hypothetical protein
MERRELGFGEDEFRYLGGKIREGMNLKVMINKCFRKEIGMINVCFVREDGNRLGGGRDWYLMVMEGCVSIWMGENLGISEIGKIK